MFLKAPNTFIFNLNTNTKWHPRYTERNVRVVTYKSDSFYSILDFGYRLSLTFMTDGGSEIEVTYIPKGDFYSDPTSVEMGLPSTKATLDKFEVYQVSY